MTGNLEGFDPSTVERTPSGFEALPAGAYKVIITGSKTKPTRAGTGEYLELELQIIDGEYQNRKLWDRINRKNPNPVAVTIGDERLAEICDSLEITKPRDSAELHNQPLIAVLSCTKRKDSDEMQNNVKQYRPVDAVPTAKAPTDESVPW